MRAFASQTTIAVAEVDRAMLALLGALRQVRGDAALADESLRLVAELARLRDSLRRRRSDVPRNVIHLHAERRP